MSAMQTADDEFQSLVKSLDKLVQLEKKLAQASHESAGHAFAQVSVALIVLLLLALVISGGAAFFMSRVIVRPLTNAIELADHIANGDLSAEIKVDGHDETADLLRALARMTDSLKQIVGEVRHGTETIAVASREIASGNADLSSRTESQASSLEETASSMEELTSTVKQN
ncbi:MAG: HAMP domain-containing protein, partial [Thiobacillus sp.]|nr:HAMP domain-containing protein [Thiobacillus sp.]